MYNLAIDFGITCTDLVLQDSSSGEFKLFFSTGFMADLTEQSLLSLLAQYDITHADLNVIVVTGGHHAKVASIADKPVLHVNEIDAIGQAAKFFCPAKKIIGCITSGSGTGSVLVTPDSMIHTGGTPSGGGTLMGMAKLILGIDDPRELNRMANAGNSNSVHLNMAEAVTGPIGSLSPDAPAAYFAKMNRNAKPSQQDIAAGLCEVIGAGIGMLAASLSSHHKTDIVCIIGRTPKIDKVRMTIESFLKLGERNFIFPNCAEFGTAIGALQSARMHK